MSGCERQWGKGRQQGPRERGYVVLTNLNRISEAILRLSLDAGNGGGILGGASGAEAPGMALDCWVVEDPLAEGGMEEAGEETSCRYGRQILTIGGSDGLCGVFQKRNGK